MSPAPTDARISPATLARLAELWPGASAAPHAPDAIQPADPGGGWGWQCPFVTPPWLAAWWRNFGQDQEPLLLEVSLGGRPAGVAPLMRQGGAARFMASPDLCDYVDFPVAPGAREGFFQALLRHLTSEGIRELVLEPVRPDAAVMQALAPAARAAGCPVEISRIGVSLEMPLPDTWDGYLESLSGKQRHEARRKLRRAADAGPMAVRAVREASETGPAMDAFFHLFRRSRPDKEAFMTPRREAFFRDLAGELARAGMLNLTRIDIDGRLAAAVFLVELGNTAYLYNNGYDPRYRGVSIGVVSKLITIRGAIDAGLGAYDFLNGAEPYKHRMGGVEVPLSRCVVNLR